MSDTKNSEDSMMRRTATRVRARLDRGTMARATQGLLMAFLGAVLLRLALTDAYLRYVTPWMKWPIVLSGLLLLALAAGLVIRGGDDEHDDEHAHDDGPVPIVTWLLVLPGLVTFVISPPQLGAYTAERRSGQAQAVAEPDELTDLGGSGAVEVDVTEFIWRAQDGGTTLEDQEVELTGFVSYDGEDGWYVTRMVIGCCAADGTAYQVGVEGAERPPRDQWVKVTGTYVTGSGTDFTSPPVIDASDVEKTRTPKQTYG